MCDIEFDIVDERDPRGVPDADTIVVEDVNGDDTIVMVGTLGIVALPYHQRRPEDAVVEDA